MLVSWKENILVPLKVIASISTKPSWKRLRRRMDFPSDGYRSGHSPIVLPGNRDGPLNDI